MRDTTDRLHPALVPLCSGAKARVLFHLLREQVRVRELDLAPVLRAVQVGTPAHRAVLEWIHRQDLLGALEWELGLHDVDPEDDVLEELARLGLRARAAPDWAERQEAGTDVESE